MKTLLSSILCVVSLPAIGQSYLVPDTNIIITKTTDFGVLHAYAEVVNLTDSAFDMQWRCRFSLEFPTQWSVSFDDQQTYFPVLLDGDSSDIVLDTLGQFPRKLIIGVMHNNVVGAGTVTVTIFPLSSPSDSMRIHYIVTVTPGSGTSASMLLSTPGVSVNDGFITVQSQEWIERIIVHDLLGRVLVSLQPNSTETHFRLRHHDHDLLFLTLTTSTRVMTVPVMNQ